MDGLAARSKDKGAGSCARVFQGNYESRTMTDQTTDPLPADDAGYDRLFAESLELMARKHDEARNGVSDAEQTARRWTDHLGNMQRENPAALAEQMISDHLHQMLRQNREIALAQPFSPEVVAGFKAVRNAIFRLAPKRFGHCACMGPRDGDPFCACLMALCLRDEAGNWVNVYEQNDAADTTPTPPQSPHTSTPAGP